MRPPAAHPLQRWLGAGGGTGTQVGGQFYAEVMAALRELTLEVSIRTAGTEVERAIPFQDDHEHASYDPDHVRRFWQQLVPAAGIFRLPGASITNDTSSSRGWRSG